MFFFSPPPPSPFKFFPSQHMCRRTCQCLPCLRVHSAYADRRTLCCARPFCKRVPKGRWHGIAHMQVTHSRRIKLIIVTVPLLKVEEDPRRERQESSVGLREPYKARGLSVGLPGIVDRLHDCFVCRRDASRTGGRSLLCRVLRQMGLRVISRTAL